MSCPREGARAVLELARGIEVEKRSQLARLADFHARNADDAPVALERLRGSRPRAATPSPS